MLKRCVPSTYYGLFLSNRIKGWNEITGMEEFYIFNFQFCFKVIHKLSTHKLSTKNEKNANLCF